MLGGCKATGIFKRRDSAPPGDAPAETQTAAQAAPVNRSPEEEAFLAKCAELGGSGLAVAGEDGYCFSATELKRLAALHNPNAPSVRSAIAAITDYHNQLRRAGTEVVLVPVPPKAVIFADRLSKDLKFPRRWSRSPGRVDSSLQTIYGTLRARGVPVVDVTDEFLKRRVDRKAGGVFARGGDVWTPRGAQIAAEVIASNWKNAEWAGRPGSGGAMTTEEASTVWTGPLFAAAGINPQAETLAVRNIGQALDGRMRSVTFSQGGHPLALLGDRTILAWREANNPPGSTGVFASLADQLAYELQTTPDILHHPTDARNGARLKILRDGTNGRNTLARTKLLLWVVPATDFALADWRKVPLRLNFDLSMPDIDLDDSTGRPAPSPGPAPDSTDIPTPDDDAPLPE